MSYKIFKDIFRSVLGNINFKLPSNSFLFPRPQMQLLSPIAVQPQQSAENDLVSVFDQVIWRMGVPKSKVTPSRKKMKHGRYLPDRIEWYKCPRCGEPKRPHRICSKNMDICAMREDDWQNKLKENSRIDTN